MTESILREQIRIVLIPNYSGLVMPTGSGALGGCRVLLRTQSHGVESPPRSRLRCHGAASGVGRRKTVPRTRVHTMTMGLRRAGYRSRYRLRKQVVEPVFGQIKQARGFRQFLLRGLSQVAAEWSLLCSVHNMLKLAGTRGGRPQNWATRRARRPQATAEAR